jgi:hypothetical protein
MQTEAAHPTQSARTPAGAPSRSERLYACQENNSVSVCCCAAARARVQASQQQQRQLSAKPREDHTQVTTRTGSDCMPASYPATVRTRIHTDTTTTYGRAMDLMRSTAQHTPALEPESSRAGSACTALDESCVCTNKGCLLHAAQPHANDNAPCLLASCLGAARMRCIHTAAAAPPPAAVRLAATRALLQPHWQQLCCAAPVGQTPTAARSHKSQGNLTTCTTP